MIEGFFWVSKFSIPGFFFGQDNLARIFFIQYKIRGGARVSLVLRIKYNQTFRVISFNAFWTVFKGSKIWHWNFLGLMFGLGIFLLFC